MPNLTPEAIDLLEQTTGRVWSVAGEKQLGEYDRLIGDHGLAKVAEAFAAVSAEVENPTARQLIWPAMKRLEPMPTLRAVPDETNDLEEQKRSERRTAAVWERRLQHYRDGGAWHEDWGPKPDEAKT